MQINDSWRAVGSIKINNKCFIKDIFAQQVSSSSEMLSTKYTNTSNYKQKPTTFDPTIHSSVLNERLWSTGLR